MAERPIIVRLDLEEGTECRLTPNFDWVADNGQYKDGTYIRFDSSAAAEAVCVLLNGASISERFILRVSSD